MTVLPEWLQLASTGLSASDYEALPEDLCRLIEVVDGGVVVLPAPHRSHQRLVRRLADALEHHCGDDAAVTTSVDLRLREQPLLNRRPDIVVFDAGLPDDAILRPGDCRLVVEVMSGNSVTADQLDKPAEYAWAGIEHFWRVEDTGGAADRRVFRYVLNPATRTYASAGVDDTVMFTSSPFPVDIDLRGLS